MKLYALCLLVVTIVVSFFASGCAATSTEFAPLSPVGRPGEMIVEFTDSTPRNFEHGTPATRMVPNSTKDLTSQR
ncbi:MAG: hypothetical protein ABIO72_05715 [Patescibacteria group bacterium]